MGPGGDAGLTTTLDRLAGMTAPRTVGTEGAGGSRLVAAIDGLWATAATPGWIGVSRPCACARVGEALSVMGASGGCP